MEKLKKPSARRILNVIECLTLIYNDSPKKEKDNDELMETIYFLSHLYSKTCKHKHNDWIKEFEKIELNFKKMGYLK